MSSSLDDPNWVPIVGLNFAYTYYPTYAEVLHAYQQTTNTPVFMGEEHYEFESLGGGGQELGTPLVLRHQEYWTLLSGAAGQLYGKWQTLTFRERLEELSGNHGSHPIKLRNSAVRVSRVV